MKKWRLAVFMMMTMLLLAACSNEIVEEEPASEETSAVASSDEKESEDAKEVSLQLLKSEKIGEYLADENGMTLYYFKKDEPGVSNCSGDCLQKWPPFIADGFSVPEGFQAEDFSTITREDTGVKQVTYKGYPLYYFFNDKQMGDVNGQGVKDVWFIVNEEVSFE